MAPGTTATTVPLTRHPVVRSGVLDRRSRPPRGRVPHAARHAWPPVLRRVGVPRLAVPAGPRLLRPHPPRGRLRREPQPAAVLLGRRRQHRRPPRRAQRVLRVDDRDGRPQALPAAQPRRQGLHAQGGRQGRALRDRQGQGRRRPHARGQPERRVRLRRVDRRPAAAADHLRDDGHPGVRHRSGLRLDQRHPRRRRPRVRRHVREPDEGLAGDLRLRPGDGRGPPRQPARRPHVGADGRRDRRRPPHAAGVRLVLHPARRRRQRDDAQRHQPRHEGAHRAPRPARPVVRRLRGAHEDRRSRRSSAGPPR